MQITIADATTQTTYKTIKKWKVMKFSDEKKWWETAKSYLRRPILNSVWWLHRGTYHRPYYIHRVWAASAHVIRSMWISLRFRVKWNRPQWYSRWMTADRPHRLAIVDALPECARHFHWPPQMNKIVSIHRATLGHPRYRSVPAPLHAPSVFYYYTPSPVSVYWHFSSAIPWACHCPDLIGYFQWQ